jgi:hypothetical protein
MKMLCLLYPADCGEGTVASVANQRYVAVLPVVRIPEELTRNFDE